ncbi:NETI motif-containing protein [Alkalicoccus luteus]|uniref:NETI motif-containing protein n=1 Tax=Alkalicoccus luteus TaxID=1237094 RepID=A0A969PS21_9BACI|nr:NETI motif-containing protein [Alkalicoccus luteus]NJP39357.1 NETI motif-containing protein [Alkalicoccus luteus]
MAKKKFYVEANETIDDCLNRMAAEGYTPVRRMEEPVLKEKGKDVEVAYQRIVFEGKRS